MAPYLRELKALRTVYILVSDDGNEICLGAEETLKEINRRLLAKE